MLTFQRKQTLSHPRKLGCSLVIHNVHVYRFIGSFFYANASRNADLVYRSNDFYQYTCTRTTDRDGGVAGVTRGRKRSVKIVRKSMYTADARKSREPTLVATCSRTITELPVGREPDGYQSPLVARVRDVLRCTVCARGADGTLRGTESGGVNGVNMTQLRRSLKVDICS